MSLRGTSDFGAVRWALVPLSLALAGCAYSGGAGAAHSGAHHADYPEAAIYTVSSDPMIEVDNALASAAANNTRVLLVMGANWCHDSRALAGWLETDRFATLVDTHYERVIVNIGMPQSGDGHNLDIAQRFGLEDLPGTPNVLVITADGTLLNAETATTWRNAASRSEDEIFEELQELATRTI